MARIYGVLAVFLPALDVAFNLGVWFVHSAMNGFERGYDDVVFYHQQFWFWWIYLCCVIGGLVSWPLASAGGVSIKHGRMFTMIAAATFTMVLQFIMTFAGYQ